MKRIIVMLGSLIIVLALFACDKKADTADTADTADRQRHEATLRRARDNIEQNAPVFVRRDDIEEAQFVGAGRIVSGGGFDGIAGVDKIDKIDAFDDTAVFDV